MELRLISCLLFCFITLTFTQVSEKKPKQKELLNKTENNLGDQTQNKDFAQTKLEVDSVDEGNELGYAEEDSGEEEESESEETDDEESKGTNTMRENDPGKIPDRSIKDLQKQNLSDNNNKILNYNNTKANITTTKGTIKSKTDSKETIANKTEVKVSNKSDKINESQQDQTNKTKPDVSKETDKIGDSLKSEANETKLKYNNSKKNLEPKKDQVLKTDEKKQELNVSNTKEQAQKPNDAYVQTKESPVIMNEQNKQGNEVQSADVTKVSNDTNKSKDSKETDKISEFTRQINNTEPKLATVETNNKPLNMTAPNDVKEGRNNSMPNKNYTSDKHAYSMPSKRPHIVVIVADDLGWDDVSCHGSDQIMTPNIDTLMYSGMRIQRYYTDVQGTASRSAFFTGKHPVKLGTQGASIKASEDRGIPVSERLLPSYLRDLGYATHLVGKWDVGKSRQHYLPTSRGFDTFYGFLGSAVDYYTYNLIEESNQTTFFGLDLFDGTTPVENQSGHLTEVLTDRAIRLIREHKPEEPLYLHMSHAAPHSGGGLVSVQAPERDIQANEHIAHSARRVFAGLVTSLDKSVGNIVAALAEKDMLRNTLIVFMSDNGAATSGPTQNYGSNLPLRGLKDTPWEGGARSIALLWHTSLKPASTNELFHVTDWLPTLISAAGGNITDKIDGVDQWKAMIDPKTSRSKRSEVLVTIDERWAALIEGHFKLIVGYVDKVNSGYQGMELKALRNKPLSYESVLIESETYRVFKETLKLVLNVNEALNMRRESNLTQMTKENGGELCIPNKARGCLFNITADPIEAKDLWTTHPDIVRRLTLRLRTVWSELKPRETKRDPRANPAPRKYVWLPWVNNEELKMEKNLTVPEFPLQVSMGELQYLVDLNMDMFTAKMYDHIKNMGDSLMRSVNGLFQF